MTAFNNAYNESITLTEEQEKCLNYHAGEKTLMIKGYAGAGKSLVLQANALKYINMYPEGSRDHKIAVFTYTNALTTVTRELLDANVGGKEIVTSTLDRYLADVYKAMGGPYKKMYYGEIRQSNIKQAILVHEKQTSAHRLHKLPLKFWEEEIDWMKGMNVTPDDWEYYISIPRKGRGTAVRMTRLDREVAFEIFSAYCEINDSKGCGDWSDFALYINRKLKKYSDAKAKGEDVSYPIPSHLMFDMVLVDEAQDLSLAQMLAVMGLYNKAMMIAMDAHQRIYAANWTPKQLGIDTKTEWLKKSMRNTVEIDALAESLRKRNEFILGADEKEKRAIPFRHGDKPIICGFNIFSEEKTFVISQIKEWLSESSEIRIGLICATKRQVEDFSAWCSDAGIYHEIIKKDSTFSMKTPGLKILNAYNAKGLEFFRVIIPEFAEGYFPFKIRTDDPDEIELALVQYRSLAYVAMTRAQESLVITFSGNHPSRFISEMDDSLYEKSGNNKKAATLIRQASVGNIVKNTESIPEEDSNSNSGDIDLISFFNNKGYKCVDKRKAIGGCLWVIGSREELTPVIREAKKIFGDLGENNFSEHGGRATDHSPAWFITSNK